MLRIGEVFRLLGLEPDQAIFDRQGPAAKRAYADLLRANQTPSERMMARVLFYLGCNVKAQEPLLGWIVDFLDEEQRVVIEVDGDSHAGKEDADAFRDEKMREAGYRVIRIEAREVPFMLQAVAAAREAA